MRHTQDYRSTLEKLGRDLNTFTPIDMEDSLRFTQWVDKQLSTLPNQKEAVSAYCSKHPDWPLTKLALLRRVTSTWESLYEVAIWLEEFKVNDTSIYDQLLTIAKYWSMKRIEVRLIGTHS